MIGKQILHYKVVEELGRGGMGVVYKARDAKLKREVAIKFLPRQIAANEEERERFKIEAQAAAALNHPNIATIHNIEEHDGEMFIVMEYIEGQELREIVGAYNHTPLPMDDVFSYATQIASGLQAAHEKGITHRDIKSSNIMVTDKGQVKIMDFGLAKVHGSAQFTKVGTTLGTTAYMSPEQARGEAVDHRTDIWAFGVVLYEMLTGAFPFRGDYEQAVIYSILNEKPELTDQIPPAFRKFLQKTLAKKPGERYQNAQALLADLRGLNAAPTATLTGSITGPALKGKILFAIAGIAVIAILTMFVLFMSGETTDTSDRKSIAVLPFENLSADAENEFFSDGITEDIISQLAKISDLRVISRTSVMLYKKRTKSVKQIADELNVATILEGSVRRSGDQVRIVAQLIDAKNDEHLWTETYDREMRQIFAIQSEVAHQIGAALEARLSPREEQLLSQQPTESLEAYTFYLKSRHHFLKYTREDMEEGVSLAKKATEHDPSFALAYVGLAEAYYRAASIFIPSNEAMPKAREAALKAIELDNTVASAYVALGVVAYRYELKWQEAEEHFKRALSLNPGDATAHEEYGSYFLMAQGRFDEAIKELKIALQLDPYSAIVNTKLQMTYLFRGDYLLSVEQADYTQSIRPYALSQLIRGAALQELGRTDEALVSYKKAIELGFSSNIVRAYQVITYFSSNKVDRAEDLLEIIEQRVAEEPDLNYQLARIYAALGNKEEAFMWLSRAYDEKNEFLMWLKLDHPFDSIREEPRFKDMLKKVGLGE